MTLIFKTVAWIFYSQLQAKFVCPPITLIWDHANYVRSTSCMCLFNVLDSVYLVH